MRKTLILLALLVLTGGAFSGAKAQQMTDSIKPSVVTGEVISSSSDKIVLQTKDGTINVILSGKTEYKRVSPDNPSLRSAVASSLSDIGIGDKLLVTGFLAADKKAIPAKSVYLMTKSDLAQRQTKEQEEWRTRGISGKVTAVNPQAKQITVSMRGLGGEKITVLTAKDTADFRRYAPNSVQFSEAKPSSIDDIKPGDMIRALGDKGADGSTFNADRVVTGSFQTVAGTIKAIDPAKKEITINNIQTKKDVTIVVGDNSVLKQFPAEMAQRLAQMQMMQRTGGMRPPQQQNNASAQTGSQTPTTQGGGMGMRAAGGSGSIDDMLDRFPNITVADLKVGDMIALSSTKSDNVDRVTAIKLLSGVEPFLRVAQFSGGQRGQRGGQDVGFTIPGLDGNEIP